MVFGGYIDHRCNDTVSGNKHIPNRHAAGNSEDMVLGPVVRHQSGFTQDGEQDGSIERCSPNPMACRLSVTLDQVSVPEKLCSNVENKGVIDGIGDPLSKYLELEEVVLLAHHV